MAEAGGFSPANQATSSTAHSASNQSANQPANLPITEGYDEDFVDPATPSSYECPLCQMVLRDAVQLACGDRYCQLCFDKYRQYNKQ